METERARDARGHEEREREREKTVNGKLGKELDLTQLDSNQMKILYTHAHAIHIEHKI